jgi:hypothetical protein
MRRVLPVVGAVTALLSGCGESSKTSTTLPPIQYENAQHILGYAKAVRETMAPFTHPFAEPTNYPAAARELRTAISRLSALTPPPQLRGAHEHLLHGLGGQLATTRKLEAAARAHDTVAISNLVAKLQPDAETIRAGIAEGNQVLIRCERARYSC